MQQDPCRKHTVSHMLTRHLRYKLTQPPNKHIQAQYTKPIRYNSQVCHNRQNGITYRYDMVHDIENIYIQQKHKYTSLVKYQTKPGNRESRPVVLLPDQPPRNLKKITHNGMRIKFPVRIFATDKLLDLQSNSIFKNRP